MPTDIIWILIGIFVLLFVGQQAVRGLLSSLKNQGVPSGIPMKNGLTGALGAIIPIALVIILFIALFISTLIFSMQTGR